MIDNRIIASTAEHNNNKEIYKKIFSRIQYVGMPTGDLADGLEKIVVEVKKGNDLTNWAHTNAQLTRLNGPEFKEWDKHLLWWVDNKMIYKKWTKWRFELQMLEYKRLVGNAENVRVHAVHSEEDFIAKIKQIFSGHYTEPLQRFMNPPKELSPIGRKLNLTHGITVAKAHMLSLSESKMHFLKILGYNKDGKMSAIQKKALAAVREMKEFADKIVGNDY